MKGYTGNKSSYGSFQQIINHFPKHEIFISGFAGSGAVEFKKRLAYRDNVVFELSHATLENYWSGTHGYRIVRSDFNAWLKTNRERLSSDTLIYADPPYLLSSRKSGREYYEFEWTETQHRDFLKTVKQCKCFIAISHYRCKLYDELLKGWSVIEWQVMTHAGVKKEALYMNYAKPKELHQYNLLGKNFTDRQRIKRKKERFIAKLERMPELERYAVLNAIQEYLKH